MPERARAKDRFPVRHGYQPPPRRKDGPARLRPGLQSAKENAPADGALPFPPIPRESAELGRGDVPGELRLDRVAQSVRMGLDSRALHDRMPRGTGGKPTQGAQAGAGEAPPIRPPRCEISKKRVHMKHLRPASANGTQATEEHAG
eukprot:4058881-Heterocapsa_arctica.AAC.1